MRKIIHIDMDAFYASVEQRDNPELRGKPVAVGGASRRGVVAAASYEARKFGVHSAMPSLTAQRLCPELVFVRARFDAYRDVSRQIRSIFHEYTDLVEPLSLDEAYLDVTLNKKEIHSATLIAREIRARIQEETQLTASAGISFNKFLAKMASGMNKPNGMTLIGPEHAETFIEQLPIGKFYGIGERTAEKMKRLGIHTGADLRQWSELDLARRFGKTGRWYYRIARGMDDRGVQPNRVRKSLGAENTFFDDLHTEDQMQAALESIVQKVCERLLQASCSGRTLTLKIKYNDFTQTTRSRSFPHYLFQFEEVYQIACSLLLSPFFPVKP
ncbi:MAG: DNA polymerase IV, partial [Bacteroidetes bacterium]